MRAAFLADYVPAPIAEQFLNDEVCVRFGFCGEEYDTILRDLKQNGKGEVRF